MCKLIGLIIYTFTHLHIRTLSIIYSFAHLHIKYHLHIKIYSSTTSLFKLLSSTFSCLK